MLNLVGFLGAIEVFFSATVKNYELIFFKSYFIAIIKALGIASNSALISIEGKKLIYSVKNNSGIETIKINEINTNIEVNPYEKISYVAISPNKLMNQLLLQKCLYKYLYLISKLFKYTSSTSYLKETISTCYKNINMVKKLNLENKKLSNSNKNTNNFDSWFLENIQYISNDKSELKHISFERLFLLKCSFGYSNEKTKNKINFLKNESSNLNKGDLFNKLLIPKGKPKKVFIFYIDNISYYLAENKYQDKEKFPIFSNLIRNHNLKNFKFSSTTDWTFPAAISLFSALKYSDHLTYHRNHKPYYSINNFIRNYAELASGEIRELQKIYKSMFLCGTNWRIHHHHGLSNIFNHLISNPKFTDVYDVISQAYKQIDIANGDKSLHWINFMDAHHPVKDSLLPHGALNYLNLDNIKRGLQYETGPKFDENLRNKELPTNIYHSQINSVSKAINEILTYSYKLSEPKDHLIIFLSDHGSSFCPKEDDYSKILEKHTPLLSISSEFLSPLMIERINNVRFSHFGFFKLIKYLINQDSDELPSECFSNYSQIIFPGKPYEYFYFDDENNCIYSFKSYNKIPLELIDSKHKKTNLISKDFLCIGRWTILHKNKIENIKKENLPFKVICNFNDVMPFSS